MQHSRTRRRIHTRPPPTNSYEGIPQTPDMPNGLNTLLRMATTDHKGVQALRTSKLIQIQQRILPGKGQGTNAALQAQLAEWTQQIPEQVGPICEDTLVKAAELATQACNRSQLQTTARQRVTITIEKWEVTKALRDTIEKRGNQGEGTIPVQIVNPNTNKEFTHWAWFSSPTVSGATLKAWVGGIQKGTEWWLMNISDKEVRGDAGQHLAPGGLIHCATCDDGGWSVESNKEMQMAILWREEKTNTQGHEKLWTSNVEGLSQEKMKVLETWVHKEEARTFAIALTEVRRATGRRRVGPMQAHWSLDKERKAGVGLLLSARATIQMLGKIEEPQKSSGQNWIRRFRRPKPKNKASSSLGILMQHRQTRGVTADPQEGTRHCKGS
eukprot:gene7573-biopygen9091